MDDDIAASLPPPPPAAPARREAAIAMAMRRFDGVDDPAHDRSRPPHRERRSPWWTQLGRPQADALASIALVALVGLPIAWIAIDRPPDSDGVVRGPALGERVVATDEMAAPGTDAPALAARAAVPSSKDAPAPIAPPAGIAAPIELARAEPLPPAAAPPAVAAFTEQGEASSAKLAARAPDDIIVTGSRVQSSSPARANPAAPAMLADAEEADTAIIVTAARAAPVGRGDWNACTVDDPLRSLNTCDRAIVGANGRAAQQVTNGLILAWKGDLDGGIAAFDTAIAIAPRFAFAYLNRAIAYRRQGQLDRALADANRAVRYAPNAARGYYQRSLVHRARGQTSRANADERRAIELDARYAALLGGR